MSKKWNEKEIYPIPSDWDNFDENRFNDWLFENINYIESVLNLGELNNVERESRNSDDKRLDILASYQGENNEEYIAIESQLNSADFSHFGRLIMYMATNSRLPKVGVWIVKDATDLHKASVDWLNNNIVNCDFWLLSVNTIVMNGQSMGVDIISLVEPNIITKVNQNKARVQEQEQVSEHRQGYIKFWNLFNQLELENNYNWGKAGRLGTWARLFSKSGITCGLWNSNNAFNLHIALGDEQRWLDNKEKWCEELTNATEIPWTAREGGQKNRVFFVETIIQNNWTQMNDDELKTEINKLFPIIEKVQKFLDKQ